MMPRHIIRVICVLLAVSAAGCASQRPNYFTLIPLENRSAAATDYSVAVGPVSIPDVVDRPQIVLRSGPGQVVLDEFNRWASPLSGDIARVVAADLSAALGTPLVSVISMPAASGARYRVAIDVAAFESTLGGNAALDAFWTIRDTKGGPTRQGHSSIREETGGKSYSDLVEAHSRALARLSEAIAAAIREMEGATAR